MYFIAGRKVCSSAALWDLEGCRTWSARAVFATSVDADKLNESLIHVHRCGHRYDKRKKGFQKQSEVGQE